MKKPQVKLFLSKTNPPVVIPMNGTWKQYNQSLINRGNINFWFSKKTIKKWQAKPSKSVDRPKVFSDEAILFIHILRFVYCLPLRQLQGFLTYIVEQLDIPLDIPHFTSIGKRFKKLKLPKELKDKRGITDIVFDTSGIKIYQNGEWKKHKFGGKRKWKKISMGIDLKTKEILFIKVSNDSTHDLTYLKEELDQGNKREGKVLIDEIADCEKAYQLTKDYNKQLLTLPRFNASLRSEIEGRKEPVKILQILGKDLEARKIWAKLTGYNERVHIETEFSRWKRIFGESLESRIEEIMEREVFIKSWILNKMRKQSF